MTGQLRDLLHALADEQEQVRVDPDTYAAGRRAHRRGVLARGALAAAAVAGVAFGTLPLLEEDAPGPAIGDPVPALPSVIRPVPDRLAGHREDGYEWHEDVGADSLAVGATAVVLPVNGGAVMAVSAIDGHYRGLKLPGFDEDSYFRFDGSSPVALSPDGARLAYTWNPDVIDGDALEPGPETGIRIADLGTGEVTDHPIDSEFGVYAFGFGWSPDGRYLSYELQTVTDANGGVRGSRNYAVELLDTVAGERARLPLSPTEFGTTVNDAGQVAVAGGGYNAVWTPGEEVITFEGDFAGVSWSPQGRLLGLGSWSGGLAVADRNGIRQELSGERTSPDDMAYVRTRVLGWPETSALAVLHLGESSVRMHSADLDFSMTLLTADGVQGLDQISVATDLLGRPTRDYPAPDWPTDWTRVGLWLRLSALILVPSALLVWVRRRRRR